MAPPLPEYFKIIDMVEPDTPEPAPDPIVGRNRPQHASATASTLHQDKPSVTNSPLPPPPLPPADETGMYRDNPEFRKRIISAILLGPAVLLAVALGGAVFYTLIILLAILMMREWDALVKHRTSSTWSVSGVLYVTTTCISLVLLREESMGGSLPLLLYLLAVVWATDIGAYFAGRQIGGPKLAPSLSPSKTWAGLGGGTLSASAIGGLLAFFFHFPPTGWQGVLIGALLAIVAQLGDLFESWLKRKAGVKDSSALIPGHGGILDRVDSLAFTAPLLLILYYSALSAEQAIASL